MAETVTGSLTDFGDVIIPADLRPELWFVPDRAAVSVATSRLYPRAAVKAALSTTTGNWHAELAPTGSLRPRTKFRPLIKYFHADGSFHSQDYIDLSFPVPTGGGKLASILDLPPEPGTVIVDSGPPPPDLTNVLYIDWDDVTGDGVMVYGPGRA